MVPTAFRLSWARRGGDRKLVDSRCVILRAAAVGEDDILWTNIFQSAGGFPGIACLTTLSSLRSVC